MLRTGSLPCARAPRRAPADPRLAVPRAQGGRGIFCGNLLGAMKEHPALPHLVSLLPKHAGRRGDVEAT